jgi:uncharacterized protein YjiS (DUF1127 family)
MTTIDYSDQPLAERRRLDLLGWLGRIIANRREAARRRRAMQGIAALDAHLLRDIGLNVEDIDRGVLGKHRSIWLNPLTDDR